MSLEVLKKFSCHQCSVEDVYLIWANINKKEDRFCMSDIIEYTLTVKSVMFSEEHSSYQPALMSALLSSQFVWILSLLCGTDLCWSFVYGRPKRSEEDGASARTECKYTTHV